MNPGRIHASESHFLYDHIGSAGTSPGLLQGKLSGYNRYRDAYRGHNNESTAVVVAYELERSGFSNLVETACKGLDRNAGWISNDLSVSKRLGQYGSWVKRFTGFDTAQIVDSGSTVVSPRNDALLHLRNIKRYEVRYSRRKALDYMFDALEQAFDNMEVEMLNCMLNAAGQELDPHGLGISLLRATFRGRKSLVMWSVYRKVVEESLHDHPDRRKLLRGLVG